jgi:NifB/MoaA-like Fe-S oxidoreductase
MKNTSPSKNITVIRVFGKEVRIDDDTKMVIFPSDIDRDVFLKICNYLDEEGFLSGK